MDARVRVASPADAAEAGRLLDEFNTAFDTFTPGPDVLAERLGPIIRDGDAIVVLAADPPVGVAVLRLRRAIFEEGLAAYLEELYVAQARRGEGLGRALLDAVVEVARERGARWIELGTSEDDVAARALYESAGFTNREGRPDGPTMLYYERDL